MVPINEILKLTLDKSSKFFVRPYTDYEPFYDEEIKELAYLDKNRDKDIKSVGPFGGYSNGYYFGEDPANDPVKYQYLPVTDFIQLHSPPFGTIFNIKDNFQYLVQNVNQQQLRRNIPDPADPRTEIISRGRELARMFESETPGLFHRHALNYIFYKRGEISPIRQSRVWMALDVAIYSALIAAWYFKWAAD